MSSRSKTLNFLKTHPRFFVNHLQNAYPLSPVLIEKYKAIWDWGSLSWNEELPWSTEFFIRFKDHWLWGSNEEEIVPSVTDNMAIKWNTQLLEICSEKMDWEWISQKTDILLEYPDIFEKFKDKLFWDYISGNEFLKWSEQFIEKFQDYLRWDYLSGNRGINWAPAMKEKFKEKFNIERFRNGNYELWLSRDNRIDLQTSGPQKVNSLDSGEPVNFNLLSCNENTLWTESIIDRYKDFLNWEFLSKNEALPWSEELIEKYMDRWEWGHADYQKDGILFTLGLSDNPALPWSFSFINKYKDRWLWHMLSYNEGIPWSLEIINEYYDLWVWESLTWNRKLWENVFYPYLDDEVIDDLLCRIREKLADTAK